jgi:nicotinamidase/pyrazinamidase
MEDKVLVVIDMQNDFVSGALKNEEAEKIVADVAAMVGEYVNKGIPVFFTRDTHDADYLNTQEGRLLPVPHCIAGTDGWQIVKELRGFVKEGREGNVFDKPSFGSMYLPQWLREKLDGMPETIEFCGVCTDICVISNAMIMKAAFPEMEIAVKGDFCAGVTPESHRTALSAMKSCQINIE